MGRVNLIKMNVLPRILCPMQRLPLKISNSVFSDFDKAISKFIWHGKKLTEAQPVTSDIELLLLQCQNSKKIISYFYRKLQSLNLCNIDKIKGLWHRDLETEFGEEAWSDAIASISKIFLCNRLTV